MARTLSSKDLSRLLSGFEEQGCTVKDIGIGYRIYPPNDGMILTLHMTVSDHRAMKNLRSQAKRIGLKWPLEGGKK